VGRRLGRGRHWRGGLLEVEGEAVGKHEAEERGCVMWRPTAGVARSPSA
jgi:hypothetical protein